MRGYSALTVFSGDEINLFRRAIDIVDSFPEYHDGALIRCHEVARAVDFILAPFCSALKGIDTRVVDGVYHSVEHSWLVVRRRDADGKMVGTSVLDTYAIGSLPIVRLLCTSWNIKPYEERTPRTDIKSDAIKALLTAWRERT